MKNIAIVSPSNKFYGSEQVLFDFLKTTSRKYDIYVRKGLFYSKLVEQGKHNVCTYTNTSILYIKLAFQLFCNKYDSVYINEGGHSRYIDLLSRMFPWKRFFIHIRLLEDTRLNRLGTGRKNIDYISISDYITNEVKKNTGINCHTIHDLYVPTQEPKFRPISDGDVIKAGVVGRVTDTKGLADMVAFCRYVEQQKDIKKRIELHFYGTVNELSALATSFVKESVTYKNIKCVFHGFVNDKDLIYRGN